ncbi:MAG TPA: hypothetical protein EYQ61_09640 [Dehalococcoidia bacterium]|jgi:hypothetical protein|nr:hypothetical protein [Dehalococcoidia bacterium]
MLIVTFLVPRAIDTLSGDDDGIDSGDLIGYVDNTGITESLGEISGVRRIGNLADGTQLLGNEEIKALFVIPADYIESGRVDWYRKSSGLASEDSTGDGFFNFLRAAVADESLEPELVVRILDPANYVLFTVDDEGRPESSGTLQDEIAKAAPPFIFAMLLLISIVVGTAALL